MSWSVLIESLFFSCFPNVGLSNTNPQDRFFLNKWRCAFQSRDGSYCEVSVCLCVFDVRVQRLVSGDSEGQTACHMFTDSDQTAASDSAKPSTHFLIERETSPAVPRPATQNRVLFILKMIVDQTKSKHYPLILRIL